MRNFSPILISFLTLTIFSCSKSGSTDPAPTPSVTSTLAGVYKLTQLTAKAGSPTITGTGSITVTALDNTAIILRDTRQYTIGTATASPAKTTIDTLLVTGTSSPYVIKYRQNSFQWGTASPTKLTTNETLSVGTIPNLVNYTVDTEYTKQ